MISAQQLEVRAGARLLMHDVSFRVWFLQSNFLSAMRGTADLIVGNLPYMRDGERDGLPPEVGQYEPASALLGGTDGLDAFRAMLPDAAERLAEGGALIVEFGAGQEVALRELVSSLPSLSIRKVRSDLQGLPRVMVIQRGGEST